MMAMIRLQVSSGGNGTNFQQQTRCPKITMGEDLSSGRARAPGCMRDFISCSSSSLYLWDCSPLTLVAASAWKGCRACKATHGFQWLYCAFVTASMPEAGHIIRLAHPCNLRIVCHNDVLVQEASHHTCGNQPSKHRLLGMPSVHGSATRNGRPRHSSALCRLP